jgi:Secretion system C-terminal sorting domain/Bacterial Ig-like domain (group 2)
MLTPKLYEMKKIYIFFVAMIIATVNVYAQPTMSAPTPPVRNAVDVMSLYSDAYTTITTGIDWFPNWGQTTTHADITVGADNLKRYANLNYEGVQFASPLDVSNMKYLHFDIWTADCNALDWFLINLGPTVEQAINSTTTLGGWKSIDIDLSTYTNIALHKIGQFKLVGNPFSGSTIYLDNIYFYKSATTPTITNFSIPAATTSTAPFAITAPTSNSAGAFSYSSTNSSVATVSGNTITVVGQGSTTIKATQASSGSYIDGTISTTLQVDASISVPTSAALTPTKPAADVISMFSNAYSNVTVDTWSAGWDAADVADVQVAGNDNKLYTNLNYAGIEFTSATIDATTMQYFHIDAWTPNATQFRVKLVDFGANGIYGGGDDTEHELALTPLNQSAWNSFDIPLANFTGLTAKAHLAQMILVAVPGGVSTVYVDNVYFYKVPVIPGVPTVAAATPTRLQANVISLFSNAYTNVPVDTWSAVWDVADVADVQIAGNDNKLYTNLNFAGVEFTSSTINATNMEFFHIDAWTPNATEFKVKLVDLGANGTFGGGDDVEHELSLTPLNQNAWNSFDIPLSNFTGLTTKGHLGQMILVGVPSGSSTVYLDNIYFYKVPPTTPMLAAPTPPNRLAADVISIYSDSYTSSALAGVNMTPYWGQPVPTVITDEIIAGNATKKYDLLNYQGTQFASAIDLTTFDKLHIDLWTPNCTSFKLSLINTNVGNEQAYTITPTIAGWNSIDIPLTAYSSFVAAIDISAISQMKFEAVPAGTSTVFIDNLYFFKGIALPIVLTNFDAIKKANTAQLDWNTSSELNNKGFHVQRSKNATNWEVLDFVSGAGYSNQDKAYSYIDNKPTIGANYYRLMQEDFDGRKSYSDIKAVRFTEKDNVNIAIFPNPVSDVLYVDMSNLENGNAVINLINGDGKVVLSKNIIVVNGYYNASLKVNTLASGNYVLQVKQAKNNISKKLVIE